MLVLSRKLNETIVIDGNIRITVVGIRGNQIRLGIEAPDQVPILREELCAFASRGESPSSPGDRTERRGVVSGVPASPAS